MTAANTTDKEAFAVSDGDVILVQNTGGSSHTYTINSVADPVFGRTGDVSGVSIAASAIHAVRVGVDGWRQTDGKVYLEANHTEVKFGILTGLR